MAKNKDKPLTLLLSRKKLIKRHLLDNNPTIGTKFWMREIPKLNYQDFWLLYKVVEGLILRKYPDEVVEKLLTLDRRELIELRSVFDALKKSCDPIKGENPENPFTLLYDGDDYLLDEPPEKKRKKLDKPKKIGKNQKVILKALKKHFENNEEFKAKDVKSVLDEEMQNINGILKVLALKTDHVQVIGKKKYRFIE